MKEELVKAVLGELFETTKGSEVARDVMKNLLLPASSEMGEWFAEKVRLLRYSSSLKKGLEKVKKMHEAAGVPFSPVPLKKLLPLLEGLALEEVGEGKDETLHDKWSALLANSSLSGGDNVRQDFIGILKDMSADEAKLLKYMYEHEEMNQGYSPFGQHPLPLQNLKNAYVSLLGFDQDGFTVCLQSLQAHRLVEGYQMVPGKSGGFNAGNAVSIILSDRFAQSYFLTDRGMAFIRACQPPKKKEPMP